MDNEDELYEERARSIEADYYSFAHYNSKIRMLTYWHQITEVLDAQPKSVLEIGKGSGLVASFVRSKNIKLETLDINEDLDPDHIGNVAELTTFFEKDSWDVVLCSRVLHHVPFENFMDIVTQLIIVGRKRIVMSLPVDDFRFYIGSRYTSSKYKTFSLSLPLALKRMIGKAMTQGYGSGLWQLNSSSETRIHKVISALKALGHDLNYYQMPEDRSHMFIIIEK